MLGYATSKLTQLKNFNNKNWVKTTFKVHKKIFSAP